MGMSGAIVLAADNPAALARFYAELLEVYTPSRSRPQPKQPGRLALCLQRQADGSAALAVLNDWITAAMALGASLQDPPRQESFGAEAWLLDPEGNRLLLLVVP